MRPLGIPGEPPPTWLSKARDCQESDLIPGMRPWRLPSMTLTTAAEFPLAS